MKRHMDEDGMRALCAAVVANVCEEYLEARRPQHLAHLRKWFFSDDFTFYSDMDPETVVNRLDAMREANMTHLLPLYVGECSHHLHPLY